MKISKLPTFEKFSFVSKGKFFLNTTELNKTDEGSYKVVKSSITRISRFNPKDMQEYLLRKMDIPFLYYSAEPNLTKGAINFIPRSFDLREINFEIMSEVFGVDNLTIFSINYENVLVWEYENGRLIKKEYEIKMTDLTTENVNNWFFDPFASFDHPYLPELLKKKIYLAARSVKATDNIIITGEFVWANNSYDIVQLLYRVNKNMDSKICVDKYGLIECLFSTYPINAQLKFLDKENFRWTFESFEKSDTESLDITKDVEMREDYMIAVDQVQSKQSARLKSRVGVKIFDYAKDFNQDTVKFDVIQSEHVKEGARLCRVSEMGGLLQKAMRSPIDGYIDLAAASRGYVFIDPKKDRVIRMKTNTNLKLRPRLVLGSSIGGVFNENIIYVPNLRYKDYEDFVQKGKDYIICRTIETRLLSEIIENKMYLVTGLVILDGIDLEVEEISILFHIKNAIVSIDAESPEVVLHLGERLINTLDDKNMTRRSYKVGENVRVIDENFWGDYVKIVAVDSGDHKLSRHAQIRKASLINLM